MTYKSNKFLNLNNLQYNIPIILGSGINAYGICRSFREKNMKCLVLDSMKDIAALSKNTSYIEICSIDEEEKLLAELISIAKQLTLKGFLFATSDAYLDFISRKFSILALYFDYLMPERDNFEIISTKNKLYYFAKLNNIQAPKFIIVNNIDEFSKLKDEIIYPSIVKPIINDKFKSEFGEKVLFLNRSNFEDIVSKITNSSYSNKTLVIQEYIHGDVTDLYTITSYANRNSDIIAYSTGHKIRQFPPDTGTIISGRIDCNNTLLYTIAQKIIKDSKFQGISNIEFKFDRRDKSYKLMEINPRPGMWNYSSTASGVNISYISYYDFYHQVDTKQVFTGGVEVVWMNILSDLTLSLYGYRKRGFDKHQISLISWIKSVKGKKVFAIYDISDIKPFISYCYRLVKKVFK